MNTNDIINVIEHTIKSAFPDIIVFKETLIQEAEHPFFFIEEIESKYNHVIGRKYEKQVTLLIRYFNNSESNTKNDMHNISEKLADILEFMKYESIILKGINLKSKIIDNVLNFSIDVKISQLKDKDINKFGQLEVGVNAKE